MKQLSKRQLAVIEDLFAGELEEQAILEKYNVSKNLYNRWLADDRFIHQFNEHISRAYRQSQLIIARYATLAAAKLVQLTGSDSQETARKACLDIIGFSGQGSGSSIASSAPRAPDPTPVEASDQLSVEAASRLLAALAEEQDAEKNSK
jgi:hypothetical protein